MIAGMCLATLIKPSFLVSESAMCLQGVIHGRSQTVCMHACMHAGHARGQGQC